MSCLKVITLSILRGTSEARMRKNTVQPVVNSINILRAAFSTISFYQKSNKAKL